MVRTEDSGPVEDVIVNDGTRLRIRRALTGDDGALGDLNAYVHQLHAAAMPDEYRPYACDAAAQYFAGVIDDDSHPIWIAEVGKFPVAYLEAEVRSRPDNPFTTELRVLYVHQRAVAEHARRLAGVSPLAGSWLVFVLYCRGFRVGAVLPKWCSAGGCVAVDGE